MKNPDFENIDLELIDFSPRNPRKNFDDESINELAVSVREQGVLQPIGVRRVGDRFELVFGERRTRASLIVKTAIQDRNVIPALIYELTDNEALEMSITENLQRKDIHPMEEAAAFKSLLEATNLSLDEIADRFGKTRNYVGQRLKLMSLIDDLQKAYYQNRIARDLATKLSAFDASVQKDIYEEYFAQTNGELKLQHWQLENYKGNLSIAPFDLDNTELNKEFGACTTCHHNSASTASLFPDDQGKSHCTNLACFKIKRQVHYAIALQDALNDSTIELISADNSGLDKNVARDTAGHNVLTRSNYTEFEKPERPDISDGMFDIEDYDNVEDRDAEFATQMKYYEKELAQFNSAVADGKYIRAFFVNGSNAGAYTWITISKKANSSVSSKSNPLKAKADATTGEPAKITPQEIKNEITRIEMNEARKKELEGEKMQPLFYEALTKSPVFQNNISELMVVELQALVILLSDYWGYDANDKFYKYLGLKDNYDHSRVKLYAKIKTLSEKELHKALYKITRLVMSAKLKTNVDTRPGNNGLAAICVDAAAEYAPKKCTEIYAAQKIETDKRVARVNEKIEKLNNILNPKKVSVTTVKNANVYADDKKGGSKKSASKSAAPKKNTVKKDAKKAAPKKAVKKK